VIYSESFTVKADDAPRYLEKRIDRVLSKLASKLATWEDEE
jgi:hypothetical protein